MSYTQAEKQDTEVMCIWNAIKDIVAILLILILNWCKKKKNEKKCFNIDFLGLYVQNLQYK